MENSLRKWARFAHNSFLHSFVELGAFGGRCFWARFRFHSVRSAAWRQHDEAHEDLARFRPYLMAILAGQAAGMMSLSRAYVVPTYLVSAWHGLRANHPRAFSAPSHLCTACSPAWHTGSGVSSRMYVFIRLFVNWADVFSVAALPSPDEEFNATAQEILNQTPQTPAEMCDVR